ncbi:MAG TPA: hypothetical protein VF601_20540 [Beijerinckiaceae bacterium]|jgi:hypothetical protein
MEFYSFRFGEMKVAQADAASPKTMAVEMRFGFRDPERHTVEAVAVTVHVPHDPDKTVSAAEKEAYAVAQELLRTAADHCAPRSCAELVEETEKNRAFAVKTA